ncbi:energy transducer TonB [Hirschia litorea]|uniref:Protein TonB n=1 Tax=Hirschia litorea TaxID=1199156 RepID=A0ABW2IKG7_9PROT
MKIAHILPALFVLSSTTMAGALSASAEAKAPLPVPTERVMPAYPRSAEAREIEGSVTLAFDVQEDGLVQNVRVVNADQPGVFDDAAVEAISKWKFEKGTPDEGVNIVVDFQF